MTNGKSVSVLAPADCSCRLLLPSAPDLRCQSAIDSWQPLRQRQHIVDDRITNLTVQISQFRLRLAIDRYAKWSNALVLRLPQSLAGVFARIASIAIIVIVRTPIRQYNQQASAGLLFHESCRRATDGCAEPGVVLERDAADSLLHFIRILLIKVLHDIKLHVSPAFGSEPVN